jgi:hypothetical protein
MSRVAPSARHRKQTSIEPSLPRIGPPARDQVLLRIIAPALATSCALMLLLGAVFVMQIVCQTDLYFVRKQEMLGLDIQDFFYGGQLWATGQSPYSWWRYVTPPLPAAISALFVSLGWQRFLALALIVSVLSCAIGYTVVVHAFYKLQSPTGRIITALGLACMSISYPFIFLIDRVNIDGMVFALMCGAIVLAEGSWWVVAGSLLAVAASMKLYPLLLFVPIIVHRKRGLLVATVVALLILTLVTGVHPWAEYVSLRLVARGYFFRINENGSLVNFCHFIAMLIGAQGGFAYAGYGLFAVLLGATMMVDVVGYRSGNRDWLFAALGYFPFMVAVPATVYHYSFIILLALIPALCAAARSVMDRWGQAALWVTCAGIALSQTHAVALEKLQTVFRIADSTAQWAYFLPTLGLFLTIVGVLFLKFSRLRIPGGAGPPWE